jgi:hypothetical protein
MPVIVPPFAGEAVAVSSYRAMKVAVTDLAELMVTAQVVPVVVSQPVQDLKAYPVFGVAVRVNTVPALYEAAHVAPLQLTVPLASGETVVVRVYCAVKLAVTIFAVLMVTLHVPCGLSESQPVHEPNMKPVFGCAVRVNTVPELYEGAQVVPLQLIIPLPVGVIVVVRGYCVAVKFAVTDFAELIAMVQVAPFGLSQPVQLTKV